MAAVAAAHDDGGIAIDVRVPAMRIKLPTWEGKHRDPRSASESAPVQPGPGAGERQTGCGWFDSSHDLQSGLSVCEHASPDAVAADLPLAAWLDLQLSGWRIDDPA